MTLREEIQKRIKGDALDDEGVLKIHSRDTSIFERKPRLVVFPKDADDVSEIVRFVREEKKHDPSLALAARSAGTDMTGGSLTNGISLSFTRYMNAIRVDGDTASAEPGTYYRDFEKETLRVSGKIMPSYPASRELAAIGGMVSNNAGGELTLKYGQVRNFVRSLDVVLSDGSQTTCKPLTKEELEEKKSLPSFEGDIYRNMDVLLTEHADTIRNAKPSVSKNSAGYALWEIRRSDGTFDLSQLIAGSQGTLALVTRATLGLVELPKHRAMVVVFLAELDMLPMIVERVLSFSPETFESYDDQTFKLAVRFLPQILKHFGLKEMLKLAFSFLPEVALAMQGGVPKLVLMAEFAEATEEKARRKAKECLATLRSLKVPVRMAKNASDAQKYWVIRRESFSLLRKNLRGLHAAPFIDDIVVHPDDLPSFLPELNAILEKYTLIYTVAGHIGNANFHIIPLTNLADAEVRHMIPELEEKVYALVGKYKGTITGEHNDGIVRTPYLHFMFPPEMLSLFAEVKKIFDPENILNPGKKVGGSVADLEAAMIKTSS
jgi:FAD/FMN-containing dehydrogenase